ncbi:MAG: multiheme c-type cytochrome [Planctomycetota bacterium]|nr:multiheme c-type cytochrome [Planctomycetota bacterium]
MSSKTSVRQLIIAAFLGCSSMMLVNSCYHRSFLTDPFLAKKDIELSNEGLPEEMLALYQRRIKDAQSDDERQFLVDELHSKTVSGRYPSARACRACHQEHYRQWSVSPHAYAQLSPVFNAMQGTIMKQTSGTNGDFCIRCHTPVGMNLGEKVFMSNMDRDPVSREGVTCIVCHRVNQGYGKVSGRLGLVKGDIHKTVFGPSGNAGLNQVVADKERYSVKTERKQKRGQAIHSNAQKFFLINKAGFCAMCHDVNSPDGFRLEEAFSEYKSSPAAAAGESCQDCHMSKDAGTVSGYKTGPAAVINGVPTRDRKISNHMFAGPDYSVVHPGIFPHNPKAVKARDDSKEGLATMREWLTFDYKAGWGRAVFEDKVAKNPDAFDFPKRWRLAADREKAREILNDQESLLAEQSAGRKKLLQLGYKLGDIESDKSGDSITLKVNVLNGTTGHNVPTGFTAERIVFLRVTARDATGKVLFKSGDLDPNGDLRDSHSLYVHNGELPRDAFLFSLQSKFITVNERGGEREQILAVNYSQNPLAYIRPAQNSTILTGRPAGARIHKRNIPPGGKRVANYKFPVTGADIKGPIKVDVKLIAGMVPVNLVAEVSKVGFDYNMSPRQVAEAVVAGHQVLWERQLEIPLK